jgi:beta-glucosidase
LEGYLGGQAGAGALADILYGVVNPSGKLAETFPLRLEDTPCFDHFPGGPQTVEYRESIYVGYRYYDTAGQEVLFPFGHGLSYTTFAYEDLALDRTRIEAGETLMVRLTVRNTGAVAGQEVVQIYVRDLESTAFRPDKELKGFAKVHLEPGEEKRVSIPLGHRALAYYDAGLGAWCVEPGAFEILAGGSSRDIRLTARVQINSDQRPSPVERREVLGTYYRVQAEAGFGRAAFEALLGRRLPQEERAAGRPFDLNTPMCDMRSSLVGRGLGAYLQREVKARIGEDQGPTALLMESMGREAPLRLLMMSADGAVTREMLEALLLIINGRWVKGFWALMQARRSQRRV